MLGIGGLCRHTYRNPARPRLQDTLGVHHRRETSPPDSQDQMDMRTYPRHILLTDKLEYNCITE